MEEEYYVYQLLPVESGGNSSVHSPFGLLPIIITQEPEGESVYVGGAGSNQYPLPPFSSETEAIKYIKEQKAHTGPLTIVKAYSRKHG